MATTEAMGRPAAEASVIPTEGMKDFARHQVERWCQTCDKFIQWQRQYIVQGTPTPDQQRDHKDALRWLLRTTRLLSFSVATPDFPDRSIQRMVEVALWKLDQSWQTIYEPLPEAEADKLLAEVFPE